MIVLKSDWNQKHRNISKILLSLNTPLRVLFQILSSKDTSISQRIAKLHDKTMKVQWQSGGGSGHTGWRWLSWSREVTIFFKKPHDKWEATWSHREKPRREIGKRGRFGLTISSILSKQLAIFHPSVAIYAYKIDPTKHTS